MAVTNYAAKANEQAELAKTMLEQAHRISVDEALESEVVGEAQVHATLAVAYAQLATYTATGNG